MKNKQYVKIPIPFLKFKLSLSEIIIISLSYTFRYSDEIEKKIENKLKKCGSKDTNQGGNAVYALGLVGAFIYFMP